MEILLWWTTFLLVCVYFVLVFVVKAFIYLWWRPRKIERHFSEQGIKGPPYQLFIGNLKEIVGLSLKALSQPLSKSHNILPRVLAFYHHWHKLYGSNFIIWFGPKARLTISDPALIREIFVTKSECFQKYEAHPSVTKLEGEGLLNLEGEKWAHHRKIINPVFYEENLKVMIPTIEICTAKMLANWSILMTSSNKIEIDVSKSFPCLSEEVVMRTIFGSSYEDGIAVFKLQEQQMVYAIESFQKVFIPGYRYLPTKKNINSWRLDKEVNKSLMNLIEKRTKNNTNHILLDKCPSDLLEVMIKASKREKNQIITISDIVEECKTFFFAGKHTTSMLMTWTTVLLAMHPQWQDRAREEVIRVLGGRNMTCRDDVAKFKVLGMILNETLRLYPPVVASIRRPTIDLTLGGYEIPQGTELLIPILAVHHDRALWGNDAAEFNPGRFCNGVARVAKHPMAHMPFGLGARHCIGQNLAILQTKLVMAIILQHFRFEISPSYKHAPSLHMLLHPQYGAPIIFQKL